MFLSSALAQKRQQVLYTATLSGKNESPPVNAQATGTAKFIVVSNGETLNYELNTNNINAVIGAHIIESNGSLLAQVFNPYAIHNGKFIKSCHILQLVTMTNNLIKMKNPV